METQLAQKDYDQYDRQIHIWGAGNQRKIMHSTILFINCDGLCSEIAKNVVLAGMNVVLCDDNRVTASEYKTNFFLRKEDDSKLRNKCIKERLQALNPRATIQSISVQSIQSFQQHPFVVCCNPTLDELKWLYSVPMWGSLLCVWSTAEWGVILNLSYFSSVDSFLSCGEPKDSIVSFLKEALKTKAIPSPSPISIQAIIGGLLSQVLVSVVTGQEELKCALEFDACTLNGTQFEYN
ncbi:hypothetical protein WA556_002292, partial [Blastocystis sp. ATCC 50177/Nand II]